MRENTIETDKIGNSSDNVIALVNRILLNTWERIIFEKLIYDGPTHRPYFLKRN